MQLTSTLKTLLKYYKTYTYTTHDLATHKPVPRMKQHEAESAGACNEQFPFDSQPPTSPTLVQTSVTAVAKQPTEHRRREL